MCPAIGRLATQGCMKLSTRPSGDGRPSFNKCHGPFRVLCFGLPKHVTLLVMAAHRLISVTVLLEFFVLAFLRTSPFW